MMKTKLKFFLVLLAAMMLVPQGLKADTVFEYPFADLAEQCSEANGNIFGNNPLTLSSTRYDPITNGYYGVSTTYGNVTVDFSRFAFRSDCNGSNQGKGWYLCKSDHYQYNGKGLLYGNGTPEFAITNLKNGDIIEITFVGAGIAGNIDNVSLIFVSGSATKDGNTLTANSTMGTSNGVNAETITLTSTAKGDIVFKTNSVNMRLT